jgi:putative transposase
MLCRKTIKCKLVGLTKKKRHAISAEYNKLQIYLQTLDDLGLHSANKQQAERSYRNVLCEREYPISIRNDLIRIERVDNKVSKYWAKIPVASTRRLWVAIRTHADFPDGCKLCEGKLFPKNSEWFLNLTVEKDVERISAHNALGVDLGIRWAATVCDLRTGHTIFYGKRVRQIRGKYFYLRKTVTKKDFGDSEKRRVRDQLHKISREIVGWAKECNAKIVIGDLRGIRFTNNGRRFNRKMGSMPYRNLKNMIEYKANWEGIEVEIVNEAYTSVTCSSCGSKGKRKNGSFACICGYKDNADRNGAKNIAKRGFVQCSNLGGVSDHPLTAVRHA